VIELTVEEAWAIYLALDEHYNGLLAGGFLSSAAHVDQLASDLWRKIERDQP
jgi:hypothetical protein